MSVMDILRQYVDPPQGPPASDVGAHFDQVAQNAPPTDVSHGLADAFRADQTPPFGEMVGTLFGNSDPRQRAGLLNQLLSGLGGTAMSGVAAGPLGELLHRFGPTVTPEQASQVTPQQAQDAAAHAEQQNPGIIDKVSDFYAKHPALVQSLGSAALGIALGSMARRY